MKIDERLIPTVLSAALGVIPGGLIVFFGLLFLCEFYDWMSDDGPEKLQEELGLFYFSLCQAGD